MSKESNVANDQRTSQTTASGSGGRRRGGQLWRGPAELSPTAEQAHAMAREFPPGASELEADGVSRRHFMGLMGASAAFAGASLTGCVRKPKERIVPMVARPEDVIPGRPRYFRTAFNVGPRVIGLHVESQDGRPTKVEGNPDHPMSFGGTDHWAQASVLSLYDPARTKVPHRNGNPSTWEEFARFLGSQLQAGGGMAFVLPATPSPSLIALARDIQSKNGSARFYVHDLMGGVTADAGRALIGANQFSAYYDLDQADVVVTIDADIFGVDGDAVRNSQLFMRGRQIDSEQSAMNRLYAVEPSTSVTGLSADHRVALSASECGPFLASVARGLSSGGAMADTLGAAVGTQGLRDQANLKGPWLNAIVEDLKNAGGRGVVVVGQRQPAWVHALGHMINEAIGSTVARWAPGATVLPDAGNLQRFVADANSGAIKTAFFLDTNPVYTAPVDLPLETALQRIESTVHLGMHLDETAVFLAQRVSGQGQAWHLPLTHYLEAWGDLRASDGTISIQQPLIAPLWQAISMHELLGAVAGGGAAVAALADEAQRDAGHGALRTFYGAGRGGLDDSRWQQALHQGFVSGTGAGTRAAGQPPSPGGPRPRLDWRSVGAAVATATSRREAGQLELVFGIDYSVGDGRFASNAWLQELPDPATKLTWDNAVLMGPRTAQSLGVTSGNTVGITHKGDLVELKVGEHKLTTAVMVIPGVAEGTLVMPLGYGRARSIGDVGGLRGFDGYRLRTLQNPWWTRDVEVHSLGEQYPLATTQEHWSLQPREGYEERDLVEYMSLEEFKAHPDELAHEWAHHMHEIQEKRLYSPPEVFSQGQQWAMVIDLTKCTGCSACLVACQAENNISVVGKERVLNGREMHWIRIDRYFTGTMEAPGRAVAMPVPCMQCETAPCETVCPVAATQHSPDGLNDMAYNRCIGTRYCSNNCPYKVRRFNFFNFSKENTEANPLATLVRNPDVTVRFRGVMEKCTYCTQRITEARIQAKVQGDGVIPDGLQTACAQACPTDAIVFGDFNDPDTRVSRARQNKRHFMLLAYLNTLPRTTYLAQIRNQRDDLEGLG